MKISRNILVLSCFAITFVILVMVAIVRGTLFEPSLVRSLLIAFYFAGWVSLLVFCICTFLFPKIREAGGFSNLLGKAKNQKNRSGTENIPSNIPPKIEEEPKRSPRSNLPVRERINAYVKERRHEEGIAAPAPLHLAGLTQVPSISLDSQEEGTGTSTPSYAVPSMNATDAFPGFDEDLIFDLGTEHGVGNEFDEDSGINIHDNERSVNSYELPGFDGDLNLDVMDIEDISGADDLDSFEDLEHSDLMLDDSFDDSSTEEEHEFERDFHIESDITDNNLDDLGDFIDSFDEEGMEFVDDLRIDVDELPDDGTSNADNSVIEEKEMSSDKDLLDFNNSLDDEDLILSDDDLEDIGEIIDLEPDEENIE